MHTMQKNRDGGWDVTFTVSDDDYRFLAHFDNAGNAAMMVNYLNGGPTKIDHLVEFFGKF